MQLSHDMIKASVLKYGTVVKLFVFLHIVQQAFDKLYNQMDVTDYDELILYFPLTHILIYNFLIY